MSRAPVVVVPYETTRTEYVNTTVHEHRAPTDESVKLLKEMEQAARDKVEASINVGGNGFECVVNIMKEAMSMDTVAVAIFKLNGRQMRAEARVPGWDNFSSADLVGKLRDAVAQKVAAEILAPSLFAAMHNVRF